MATEEKLDRIMSALTALTSGNKTLAESSEALTQRLEALESRKPAAKIETGERTEVRVMTSSKEKSLTLAFGEGECSSQNLRLFLEHFELAKKHNVRRAVDGWDDNEFRAAELRFQLRGEPALWVAQESAMLNQWTNNDKEIIKKLNDRYMGVLSLERVIIVAFEEMAQGDNETLA